MKSLLQLCLAILAAYLPALIFFNVLAGAIYLFVFPVLALVGAAGCAATFGGGKRGLVIGFALVFVLSAALGGNLFLSYSDYSLMGH